MIVFFLVSQGIVQGFTYFFKLFVIFLIHFYTHFFKFFVILLILFFKGVIHILFKGLYCFHNGTFFHFIWVREFKSFCCRVVGIWCFHVVFQIVGGGLALASAHLFDQMLSIGTSGIGSGSLVGQGVH